MPLFAGRSALLVSTMQPSKTISSRMMCAFSRLNLRATQFFGPVCPVIFAGLHQASSHSPTGVLSLAPPHRSDLPARSRAEDPCKTSLRISEKLLESHLVSLLPLRHMSQLHVGPGPLQVPRQHVVAPSRWVSGCARLKTSKSADSMTPSGATSCRCIEP